MILKEVSFSHILIYSLEIDCLLSPLFDVPSNKRTNESIFEHFHLYIEQCNFFVFFIIFLSLKVKLKFAIWQISWLTNTLILYFFLFPFLFLDSIPFFRDLPLPDSRFFFHRIYSLTFFCIHSDINTVSYDHQTTVWFDSSLTLSYFLSFSLYF